MKKFIYSIALLAASCQPVAAQHHGHHGYHGHAGHGSWVAPLVLGGIVGYAITQNQQRQPVQIIPGPVIYSSPMVTNPPMQPVYQEVLVWQNECNCYQKQYRQIGWQ
jgi:hypothetical protein